MERVYELPTGESAVFEGLKVTDLGHVMAKFRIGDGDDTAWVNYTVGSIDEVLSSSQIFSKEKQEA